MAETKQHWSKMSEAGTILGMRTLLILYRILGRWGFRVCLFPVMLYYYLSQTTARQASKQFLSRLEQQYPELAPLSSFRHFMMFGEVLLDKLLAWMGHIKLNDVEFISDGHFEQAMAQEKGGIIVISHLGNTEVCNALAHQQPNLKLTLLVYTQHAEKFNSLIKRVSDKAQIEMYQVTDMSPAFAMLMAQRVEAGEYLVIAADRTPVTGQQRVSDVDFLGAKASLPQGAFILASLLKCPVFLMFCLKQQQHYQIHLEHFAEQLIAPRKQRAALIEASVQQYADRLAFYCRKAPLQWFNFFFFWGEKNKPHQEMK